MVKEYYAHFDKNGKIDKTDMPKDVLAWFFGELANRGFKPEDVTEIYVKNGIRKVTVQPKKGIVQWEREE